MLSTVEQGSRESSEARPVFMWDCRIPCGCGLGLWPLIQLGPQLSAGVFTWDTKEEEVTSRIHRAVAHKHSVDFSLHTFILILSLPHGSPDR